MAAPTYTAAKASTLATDAGGAWAHTTAAPAGAGELIIVHVFQDGTSAADAITIDSATNANKLDGSGTGYTPLSATGFPVGDVNTPTGYHYIFLARATGTNASVITGGNTGTNDIYVRTYQFGGVHAGLDVQHILENVTPGVAVSTAGTSTSVLAPNVTALGNERLALCFIAVADDIQGAELTAMAGESGGDWTYPVAAAGSSTGTDGTLGLVTATPDIGLAITGGADAITSEAWGTLAFALKPTTAVLVHHGVIVTPFTFDAVTAADAFTFTYQWQKDTAGNESYSNIGGATSTTYVIQPGDVGCNIRCAVTATSNHASLPTTVDSNAVGPVQSSANTVTGSIVTALTVGVVTAAKVTAKQRVDTVLTLNRVTQAKVIEKQKVDTVLTIDRVVTGKATAKQRVDTQLSFGAVTSGTVGGVKTGTVDSTFTAGIVTAGRVTAKAKVAFQLTAGIVTAGLGAITYEYQWQRDVAGNEVYGAISGATNSTYLLQAADVGCHIRCVVTATDDGGSTDADSNSVGPVSAVVVTGSVVTALTVDRVTAAKVTAKQRVDTVVTAGIVTNATRVIRGQIATALTLERVTAAKVTAKSFVVTALTASVVTNSTRVPRGQVVAPFAFTPAEVGRVTAKAATITSLTFGSVTDGNKTGVKTGAVSTALTDTIATSGRVTEKAAVVTPLTLGVVTDGTIIAAGPITYAYQWQRDTAGNSVYSNISGETNNTYVLAADDHGCHIRCVVTATDDEGSHSANSNAVGPVTATVTAAVSTALTFAAVVEGSVPQTPQTAAAGLIYMWGDYPAVAAAVDLPLTVTPVVTGRVTAKAKVDTQLAAGITVEGNVAGRREGSVLTELAATITTSGRVTARGQSATAFTLERIIAARVTAKAATVTPLTVEITTSGILTGNQEGQIDFPVTAAISTAGRVTHHGAVITPLALERVTAGRVTAKAITATTLTFGVVTEGNKAGVHTGRAASTYTATISTSGRITAKSQVVTPITFGTVTAATRIARGQISLPISAGISTAGKLRVDGQISLPLALDTVTQAGTVMSPGGVVFTALFGSSVTGRVTARGQVDYVTTADIQTVGHITALAATTSTYLFTTRTNGRHVRYSSLTLPLHVTVSTRGVTSLPGIPTIGQLLHNRIGTLDDPLAGHLEPEEALI